MRVAVESSGNCWVRLYETLEESGIKVVLTNPLKTKAIAEARIKTDRLDASTLADLLRAGLVAESYVPPRRLGIVGRCCGIEPASSAREPW